MLGRTKLWLVCGRSSARLGIGGTSPRRKKSNVEYSAPTSHGSFTDAEKLSSHVRRTATWIDSVPGSSDCIAHGQVAFELVITCLPSARSYQALLRMPWRPGWRPVMIVVWFASVIVGSDAIAPWPIAVPIAMMRATFGASPRAAMS